VELVGLLCPVRRVQGVTQLGKRFLVLRPGLRQPPVVGHLTPRRGLCAASHRVSAFYPRFSNAVNEPSRATF